MPKSEWPWDQDVKIRQQYLKRTFEEQGVRLDSIRTNGDELDFDSIYMAEQGKGVRFCKVALQYAGWH